MRIFTKKNFLIHKIIFGLLYLLPVLSKGQTTFSWRNDQFPLNNASWLNTSPHYFWNGSAGVVPPGGEILFFDGIQGTIMTNNLTALNRHKITFGNTGTPASRTINGVAANIFFDFSGTFPWIRNDATNLLHTINFPLIIGNTGSFNMELIANAGNLDFGTSATINNNGKILLIYGNDIATDATNRAIRLGGIVSGTGGLNILRFGVVKLNGTHTYTGETQVNNGELWVESSGSIASGSSIFVGNGAQPAALAKFWISNASGGTTVSNNITINNGSLNTRTLGGLNTSGTHTFSGAITNNSTTGGVNLTALTLAGTTAFTGIISGSGAIIKDGAGQVTLSGANTYTGTTTITAGTLTLGTAGVIPDASNVFMNGGTLTSGATTGNSETMGTMALSASSTLALGTGAHTITFANSSVPTWNAGTLLTITGWTGTNNGNSSGTAGRVFFGNSTAGLTGLQLSRIRFNISSVLRGAMQLPTGEVVPTAGTVLYWGGTAAQAWSTVTWSTIEGGPYNTSHVAGNHNIFNVPSSTITGATVSTAAITANENVTVTASGTLGSGGTAIPVYVAAGRTLNLGSQDIATAAGTGLIKNGFGTLTGNGSAYPGGFTLNEGMVAAAGVNIMGGAAGNTLTINGGTIAGTGNTTFAGKFSGGIIIGNNFAVGSLTAPALGTATLLFDNNTSLGNSVTRTITVGGTGIITWNGIISGTASNLVVAATAAGKLSLGGANTYDGSTTVSSGVLNIQNILATGTTAGGVSVTSGAALEMQNNIAVGAEALTLNGTGISSGGALRNISGTNSWSGAITLGAASRINSDVNTLTLSGGITGNNIGLTVGGAANTTISNTIATTTGTLTKDGTGTLVLSAANTYTGATTVSVGVLNIQNASATGTTAGGVSVTSGAVLEIQNSIAVGAEALTLNGTGISSGGALRNISGTNLWSGAITLGAASRINSDVNTLTLSGGITGATFGLTVGGAGNTTISNAIATTSGTLTKDGAGTLVLSGANIYTGATTINAGTLQISGSADRLPTTTAVTLANIAGAILDLNNLNQTIGSLAGGGITGGNVTLGSGLLTVGDVSNTTFIGNITGTGGLTKQGAGNLTLAGTNSYTGNTTISSGTITLNTTSSLSASSNIVLNGGTLAISNSIAVSSSPAAGILSLVANAIIDLGTGTNAFTLTFTDSKSATWTAFQSLTINNWSPLGGKDVYFAAQGLTVAQLDAINFNNYGLGAKFDGATNRIIPKFIYQTLSSGSGLFSASGSWVNGDNPSGTSCASNPATIIIQSGFTLTQDANYDFARIENYGAYNSNSNTITLCNGATFLNNGVVSFVAGTVVSAGTATFSGTATPANFALNILTLNGAVTLNRPPTINGNLQLNVGSSVLVAAPTYGNSSFLIYNQGGTPAFGNEWTGNANTAGSGVPQHVTIINNTTLAFPTANRGCAGNFLISSGGAMLNGTSGDLFIAGNFTNNSTFTGNGRTVTFNGIAAQALTGTTTFSGITNSNTTAAVSVTNGTTIIITGTGTFTTASTSFIVNGIIRNSGTVNGSTSTLNFSSVGVYEHNLNGGNIPLATWATGTPGSNCSIINVTNSAPGNLGQTFFNFNWNCTNQIATVPLGGFLTTINGNFNILSTGTGVLNNGLRLANAAATLTVGGNLNITSSGTTDAKLDMNTGPLTTINLSGNLTITQTANTAVIQSATGGSGLINFAGSSNQIVIIPAATNIANIINFRINNAAGITIPTGSILPINANATLFRRNGAIVLTGSGSLSYIATTSVLEYDPTGAISLATTGIEWPATGLSRVRINSTSSNAITLHASRDIPVTGIVTFTAGRIALGNFNITVLDNATTSVAGGTGYAETNGTGSLLRTILSSNNNIYLFPVGNSINYTPASFNFATNSLAGRQLGVRAVGTIHPNLLDAPAPASYINNRYWITSLSDAAGSYSYTPTYTFSIAVPIDVVGTIGNIRLSRYGTVWSNTINSSASGTSLTTAAALTQTTGNLFAGQWAGRAIKTPVTYTWSLAAGGSWTTNTNWTPNGIPGSEDIVQFTHNGNYTVTSIPTDITLARMLFSGGGTTTLNVANAGPVNIGGGTNPVLSVVAGTSIIVSGNLGSDWTILTGSTGSISGNVQVRGVSSATTHTLQADDASGLIFSTGSNFTEGVVNTLNYSGNPFGSTGLQNTVIFQDGSTFEQFDGANPFGLLQPSSKVVFNTGSLYKYSDNNVNILALPSISGRTYANFEYNSTQNKSVTGGSIFSMDKLTVTQGTFNINLDVANSSVRSDISVATGASLLFSPATSGSINLNGSSAQSISGSGGFTIGANSIINITNTAGVNLLKNITAIGLINVSGILNCAGENIISSTGTFTLNSGGTLGVGSINGIASSGATGNIQTANRNFNASGNYIYNSSVANQITGNGLPLAITSPGTLTINNTGTAPNNIVTLTTNNTTTPRLNLNAGRFNAGTNGTLQITGGGIVSGGGGNQLLSGNAADNIIQYLANGAIQNPSNTLDLYNITLGNSAGGVNFANNATINGILLMNSAAAIVSNSPKYAVGSSLIYNNTGSYTRNLEWGSNTAGNPSYPHHVTVQNNTTLNITNTTSFDLGCGGNLTIGNPSVVGSGTIVLTNYPQPNDLFVGGNLIIGGASANGLLTMSDNIGSDIYIGKDWNRNANGTVNFGGGLGRAVFFNGSDNGTITANGGQNFPFLYLIKASTTASLTLKDSVSISDVIGFTRGTFDLENKYLALLSTASKTARVDQSSDVNTSMVYSGTGRFEIQRHLPMTISSMARRWRLLTAPIKSNNAPTINAAWQEGQISVNRLIPINNTIGYGTAITNGTTAANGYDQGSTSSPSIVRFVPGAPGSWVPLPNTNSSIASFPGYMLFVRGDRSTLIAGTTVPASPTNLRVRGELNIGTVTVPLNATGFQVIGNPYASAISFNDITFNGVSPRTTSGRTFYLWDPKLTSNVGGWVTFSSLGTGFYSVAPNTGSVYLTTGIIESGAAFIVPSSGGDFVFAETSKLTSSSTTGIASRPSGNINSQKKMEFFTSNLFAGVFPNSKALDGVNIVGSNDFAEEVNENDALKIASFNSKEILSIKKDNKKLSIELKKKFTNIDTIFYEMATLPKGAYHFDLIGENIDLTLAAFFIDKEKGTKQLLSMNDTNRIAFDITTDAASTAADRFMVVFKSAATFKNIRAELAGNDVLIHWSMAGESNINRHEIQRSADGGNSFVTIASLLSKGNSDLVQYYQYTDEGLLAGNFLYRIKSIAENSIAFFSDQVSIKVLNNKKGTYIFPNPISNNIISVRMNEIDPGIYTARLLNSNGQLLLTKILYHTTSSGSHNLEPNHKLAKGIYQVELSATGKKTMVLPLLIQ